MKPDPAGRPVAALFGAVDRFNYGDLLFPIVFRELLERASPGRFAIECVGLRRSRLQRIGALPTRGIRWLLDPAHLPEGSAVIVVGGEVLGADWDRLWSYLLPERVGDLAYAALRRVVGEARLNEAIRSRFGAPWDIPFVVDPDALPAGVRVLYNAVGGIGLLSRPDSWCREVGALMEKAGYRSARDGVTRQLLEDAGVRVDLAPDSVVALSHLYSPGDLAARARPATRKLLGELGGGYLCFQCNRYFGAKSLRKMAGQLDAIAADTGWRIVLLPLGRAAGHSDQIALGQLAESMASDPILPRGTGLFDLAALVAHAGTFVGTSLHGVITAMTYGRPYVGIEKAAKLTAFLETWSITPFREGAGIDNFGDAVGERARGFEDELAAQALTLQEAGLAAFDRLHRALVDPSSGGRGDGAVPSSHLQPRQGPGG